MHHDNGTTYHSDSFRYVIHAPFVAFLFLLLLLGLPGNALSFIVYHFRWPRSNFSIFMRFLVTYDFLNLLVVVPMAVADRLLPIDMQHLTLCRLYHGFAYGFLAANGLLMVVIAAERYMKICRPQQEGITPAKAWALCATCALTGGAASVPYFQSFNYRHFVVDLSGNQTVEFDECNIGTTQTASPWIFIYFFLSGTTVIVILVVLVIVYVKIGLVIRDQKCRRRNMTGQTNPNPTARHLLTSQLSAQASLNDSAMTQGGDATLRSRGRGTMSQSTKVCIALTGLFVVTFTPYFVEAILEACEDLTERKTVLEFMRHQLLFFFPLINTVTNTVVYGFMSAQFRLECRRVLSRVIPRLGSQSNSSSNREQSENGVVE